MADQEIHFVTGATGAQGGSVARHLLNAGKQVRALTRNPASDVAKALAEQGAAPVGGDMADKASLVAAMKGCRYLFAMTNFWEHFDGEYQHGINLVDAAVEAGIEYSVFSTLPSAAMLTNDALNVPHFEMKARIEDYAREKFDNPIFVHLSFFYENFLTYFLPRPDESGELAFGFPQGDTPLAGVSVDDLGGVINPIFERPDEFVGRAVAIVGDEMPCEDYARIMSKVAGRPVKYNYIPREVFASFDFPGAEELANMFEMYRVYFPRREAELAECRKLYPEIQNFEDWAANNVEDLTAGAGG